MGNFLCCTSLSPTEQLQVMYPNYYIGRIHCYFDQLESDHIHPEGIRSNLPLYLMPSDHKTLKAMIVWEVTKSCALGRKGICLPYHSFVLFQKQELYQLIQPILAQYGKKLNSNGYLRNPLKAKIGSDADYYVIPYVTTKAVTFHSDQNQ